MAQSIIIPEPFTMSEKESLHGWSKNYERGRLVLKTEKGVKIPLFDLEFETLCNQCIRGMNRITGGSRMLLVGGVKCLLDVEQITLSDRQYETLCEWIPKYLPNPMPSKMSDLSYIPLASYLAVFACLSAADAKMHRGYLNQVFYSPYTNYAQREISGDYNDTHRRQFDINYDRYGEYAEGDYFPVCVSFSVINDYPRYSPAWSYYVKDAGKVLSACRKPEDVTKIIRKTQDDFLKAYVEHEFPITKSDFKVLLKVDFLDGSDYVFTWEKNDRYIFNQLYYYSSGKLAGMLLRSRKTIDGLVAVRGDKTLYMRTTGAVPFKTQKINLGGKNREAFYKSDEFKQMLEKMKVEAERRCVEVAVGVVKTH